MALSVIASIGFPNLQQLRNSLLVPRGLRNRAAVKLKNRKCDFYKIKLFEMSISFALKTIGISMLTTSKCNVIPATGCHMELPKDVDDFFSHKVRVFTFRGRGPARRARVLCRRKV